MIRIISRTSLKKKKFETVLRVDDDLELMLQSENKSSKLSLSEISIALHVIFEKALNVTIQMTYSKENNNSEKFINSADF